VFEWHERQPFGSEIFTGDGLATAGATEVGEMGIVQLIPRPIAIASRPAIRGVDEVGSFDVRNLLIGPPCEFPMADLGDYLEELPSGSWPTFDAHRCNTFMDPLSALSSLVCLSTEEFNESIRTVSWEIISMSRGSGDSLRPIGSNPFESIWAEKKFPYASCSGVKVIKPSGASTVPSSPPEGIGGCSCEGLDDEIVSGFGI
jgi:hypothetical protein